MIRLALIAAAFVALTAAQCDRASIDKAISNIKGDSAPFTLVATTEVVEEEALEEVVEPVVIEPPEPPRCDDYVWRGQVFSCEGTWLRDL